MTLRKMMRLIIGSVLALFVLGFSHALLGQAVNGTLLGTVTDSTGKVVANAQVTIVLTGQSAQYATVTNGSGDYTEPDLPSGTYAVTVVAQGFKKETRENIALDTNTTTRVDVTLAPGSATETSRSHDRSSRAPDRPRRHLKHDRARPDRQSSPQQRQQLSVAC